jgi:hypothetical protein
MKRATPFFFALLLSVWLSPTPAYAVALEFHTPVTYNMQGGTASYESKWTDDVKPLSQAHDVVALQEAGTDAPPTSTQIQAGQLSGYTFSVSKWDIDTHSGSESRPDYRYVYFLETDPNGHRVNLAIVIRQQADKFRLIPRVYPMAARLWACVSGA